MLKPEPELAHKEPELAHNPEYPRNLGPAVARFRKLAKGGLQALSRAERQAYGLAVETAIKALQRRELLGRALPSPEPRPIGTALRAQQRAALLAAPGIIRRRRTEEGWRKLYAEAIDAMRASRAELQQ